jgi:KDO2-lipid IV(A) lauroyltransferase
MILYLLYRIGIFLALAVPLKVSYAMACVFADVFCLCSARDRKAVVHNIRFIAGGPADDKAVEAMARDVFRNFAKYLVDFFRFQKIDGEYMKKFVRVEGRDNIDAALARGRGVIMLSAHIGNWEMGGVAVCSMGYPLSAVVLTHQNKRINDFFTRQRMRGRMMPIEIGASLRACYRTLKNNNLLAVLGDRDFTRNGIMTEFFGKRALIPKGAAVFSYRVGSAIVPSFMIRQPDDTFTLFIEKPILPDTGLEETAAIEDLTGKCAAVIESYVRKYPTQWYIFKDLWDTDAEKRMRPDTII